MTNLLRKAAEALPGKWYKGYYTDGNENYCAVGHMYRAAGASEDLTDMLDVIDKVSPQWMFAEKVLNEFTNGEFDSLPRFNDHIDTNEEDVVAFLEKAAVRWDEKVD